MFPLLAVIRNVAKNSHYTFFIYFFLIFFVFCLFFRATPASYGGSQAKGRIGAVATGVYHNHSNAESEACIRPTPQLMTMPDSYPLSKARD